MPIEIIPCRTIKRINQGKPKLQFTRLLATPFRVLLPTLRSSSIMVAKTISFFDQFIYIDRDGMIAKKKDKLCNGKDTVITELVQCTSYVEC